MKNQVCNSQTSRWSTKLILWAALALLTSMLATTARAQLTSTREGQPSQDLLSVSAIASNNHLFNVVCEDNVHETVNGVPIVISCNNSVSWTALDQTQRAGGPQISAFSPLTSIDDAFGYRVFYVDSSQNLNQMLLAPGLLAPPTNTNLGVQSWGGISGYSANGELSLASTVFERVFYETSDQHVHMLESTNGGSFADEDLTRWTGGLARYGSDFTSFHDGSGEHVFYFGLDGQLYQLYGSWTGYYICNPITRICGFISSIKWVKQPLSQPNSPLVAASLTSFSDATGEHVFYVGQDAHIHELSDAGAGWADQDLTKTATSAVLPFTANATTGLTSLSNQLGRQLFYIGTDLNVHQIVLNSSGGSDTNVTLNAKGPMANPCFGLQLTSFTRTLDSLNEIESDVFYTARDGTVHRLTQVGAEWTWWGTSFWVAFGWADEGIPLAVFDRCIQ